jgi:hypothetical protein
MAELFPPTKAARRNDLRVVISGVKLYAIAFVVHHRLLLAAQIHAFQEPLHASVA